MRQMSFFAHVSSFLKSLRERSKTGLASVALVGGWSAEQSGGIPWWAWVLLILMVLAIIIWWLLRQDDTPHTVAPQPLEAQGRTEDEPEIHVQESRVVEMHVVEEMAPPVEEAPVSQKEVTPVEASPVVVEVTPESVSKQPVSDMDISSVLDDLSIVEGIGPKISAVLQQAGIVRFSQLAELQPAQITAILKGAGLRLADPTTWPHQAELAAQGKWDDLKSLQNNLKGGRKV